MQQTVASFDLGIKNLSYCVATLDASGALISVDRWANLSLLADGADSQSQTRCGCGGPASWQDRVANRLFCKRCVKKAGGSCGGKPVLELAAGAKLADWRIWAVGGLGITEAEARKMTKTALEERASAIRLMPYKPPKARGVSFQALLVGMERCLDVELTHLARAGRIRIENQPSEFAPHMKSVQMMLFTLVDHRLRVEHGWTGSVEFVNAAVKTRGAGVAAGKENKRDRKAAGIARATEALTRAGAVAMRDWWLAQAKKDDLADALLMCLDSV